MRDNQSYSALMIELADLCRSIGLKYFRSDLATQSKFDRSPVTVADREAELAVRERIAQSYADHGFHGEETGVKPGNSPYTWVVDPIDGTKNFAAGTPIFGSLIALLGNGGPLMGIIDMPALDERWIGITGQQSLYNGRVCTTSGCSSVEQAISHATTPDMFDGRQRELFDRVTLSSRYRFFGNDCYAYGLLASGYLDLILEAGMNAYDIMAIVPIVRGAGGCISDWRGEEITLDFDGTVAATASPELHQKVIDKLGWS